MERARSAIHRGGSDAAIGIHELAEQITAPMSLGPDWIAEADLDKAAELATAHGFPNPERVAVERIRARLQNALHGLPRSLCDREYGQSEQAPRLPDR